MTGKQFYFMCYISSQGSQDQVREDANMIRTAGGFEGAES
jgi:hypothetical protein